MISAPPSPAVAETPPIFDGQFGPYTITPADRRGVYIYRGALVVSALCFAAGTILGLAVKAPWSTVAISPLFSGFSLGLGASLLTIHIYMRSLHRLLQGCWVLGAVAAFVVAHHWEPPFIETVYAQPATLWGVGFTFVALTGLFLKEAVCFNRLEAKLLAPLVPLVLLGHLTGWVPVAVERGLLVAWAGLFVLFAARKLTQAVPADIGDKSVFAHLAEQRAAARS